MSVTKQKLFDRMMARLANGGVSNDVLAKAREQWESAQDRPTSGIGVLGVLVVDDTCDFHVPVAVMQVMSLDPTSNGHNVTWRRQPHDDGRKSLIITAPKPAS